MTTIKKTVRITIEKEIEIELTPAVFDGMSVEEYLEEFKKGLWDVASIDDVIKYAARMAAYYGGGMQHDGIGHGMSDNPYNEVVMSPAGSGMSLTANQQEIERVQRIMRVGRKRNDGPAAQPKQLMPYYRQFDKRAF